MDTTPTIESGVNVINRVINPIIRNSNAPINGASVNPLQITFAILANIWVLGIINPKIYLPFQIEASDLEHVVAHEKAHIRRKDHWWMLLGFLLLITYWFNPLIWLAFGEGGVKERAEIPKAGKNWHSVVTCATAISSTEYCHGYRYWGEYDGTNFYLTRDSGKTWTRLAPKKAISKDIT